MERKLSVNTLAVHAGARRDDAFGAINTPVYMTSNYRIPTDGTPVDWSGINSNIYQRNRNVNQIVAALMSVFTTFLNSGDHAVISEVCYSATNLQFREFLPKKYGIQVTFVDITDAEAVRRAVRPNTKLIHAETPGNPTTGIADLDALARIAHEAGALLSVDATFAGPLCLPTSRSTA